VQVFNGTDKVILYFLPINQSFPLNINQPPKIDDLLIYPNEGIGLEDTFNITLVVALSETGKHNEIQFFFYFTRGTLSFSIQEIMVVDTSNFT
jgi:hypothetical protein